MTLNRGTSAAIEKGRQLQGYTDTIDAVFDTLKDNMPDYLAFAGDDRAANFEAEIVHYLTSCELKV